MLKYTPISSISTAPTWGPWSSWSGCSQSCGGGRRTRVRVCQNGNMCEGPRQEFADCNEQPCPDCKLHQRLCFQRNVCSVSSLYQILYFVQDITWTVPKLKFAACHSCNCSMIPQESLGTRLPNTSLGNYGHCETHRGQSCWDGP